MADIQLSRPAANQTQTVTSAADARFVLNFATGDAKLAKSENGENLVLTFDDGAKIEVEGFYTTFDKDNLPTLNVGGQDISGEQLVAVLGEDLMPAAGPAAGQAAAQGGRFRSFADADLNGGIDRLNGLDIGFDGAVQQNDSPEGYYALADAATATPGEVEPTPMPTPTPTPAPTPQAGFLEANDDPHAMAVMNTLQVRNFADISNDNTGSVAATAIAGTNAPSDGLPTGVTAKYDAGTNTLSLELDGKAMLGERVLDPDSGFLVQASGLLAQVPHERYDHVSDRVINYARELKPLDGEYAVEYTATDASGALTGTAVATFRVGNNTDTMTGGADTDTAWLRDNYGTVNTDGDADVIMAVNNKAGGVIDGGAGNDSIIVDSSDSGSVVNGGSGADWINFSGTNAGVINGGDGSEDGSRNPIHYRKNAKGEKSILGADEDGVIYDGNLITVYENTGEINGGKNNDIIDVVEGGRDADGNVNRIFGGAGDDRLVLRGGLSYMDGGEGNDHVQVQGDDNEHQWDNYDDPKNALADAYDAQYATLKGGAGDDSIKASDASHHNVLYGDDDNDPTIVGNDTLQIIDRSHDNAAYGGGGSDKLYVSGKAHHNLLDGGEGNDYLYAQGTTSNNTLRGGGGGDELYATTNAHDNILDGGDGNDYISVSSPHGNTLLGGAGEDTLYGGSGNDYLDGGTDSDSIFGGAGNDIIVYDAGDKYINGGTGFDFVLSDKPELTMDDLLNGGVGTKAQQVEVLIKGGDALNITSVEQMASDYGITVSGSNKLTLNGNQWTQEGGHFTYLGGDDLTLEAASFVNVQLTTGG